MSVLPIWTVFCEVNSAHCDGWVGETDTRGEAVKVALANNWRKVPRIGWTCPKCRHERVAKEADRG